MELVKANLHMDRTKYEVNTQLTLEEDKNISDRNPDAARILLEKAEIILEEIRPSKDMVTVRGKLDYEILYLSEEEEGRLYRLQGEIPFEEKVRLEGVSSIDTIEVVAELEDLRTGLINSRKLSVKALVQLCVRSEQIFDEEIPVGLMGAEQLEVQKETLCQSVVAVDRKDIFRIKEEVEFGASFLPVHEILWESLKLGKWEIRPLEDTIGIQGELHLFLLYEGEGEDRPIKTYETTIPFSGNIECSGSRSGMIAEITPRITSRHLAVKEDYDGEARMIEIEVVLDLPIHLMENREWDILKDVYGTTCQVVPIHSQGYRKKVQDKLQGKVKLSQIFSPAVPGFRILQICHVEGNLLSQEISSTNEGLQIEGIAAISILYMTAEEGKVYESIRGEIPYSYLLENAELTNNSYWKVAPVLEHCSGLLLDKETIEVKIVVGLEITLGEKWQEPTLSGLDIQALEPESLRQMPGMVVYFPGRQESLWEVGKRYLTSLESIRNLNQLTSDTLEKGQKILIVKEVN